MKNLILTILLSLSLVPIISEFCCANDEVISIVKLGPGEVETYEAALDLAKSTNTKIFLYFGADWCGYCVKMKNTTFKNENVEKTLAKDFVIIKIDVDNRKFNNIKEKFKIKSLPSYLIVDKNEDVLKKSSGYMSSKEFIDWLKK